MSDDPIRLGPSGARRPAPGIVHLGLGAFFRAHGAIYIEQAVAASGGDWGVVGVSLQSPTMRDQLAPQGFAYTALELGPEAETPRVVEILRDVLVAREDPAAVLALLADPKFRIVTLTVTEKGYCHDPSSGTLSFEHPDILNDLRNALPVSAPGYLVRALALRRAAGVTPFTVMSCDNLPENGRLLRGVVLELARAIDAGLADWIAREVEFPATMVDRIVPALRPEDLARVEEITGRADAAPVLHEPFRQWVIEDRFVGGARPDLGAVGVHLVSDVTPFEHMKLRMLNGTHSALAYLGHLSGLETIADCMDEAVFRDFAQHLWRAEIIPTLTPPPGEDLGEYAAALLARYSNGAIRHRTWQIAMDGSQKLPQRILGTLADNLRTGRDAPGVLLVVAAWMRYVGGVDEAGRTIDVRDPLAERLRACHDDAGDDAAVVAAILALREVFAPDLARAIAPGVTRAYATLAATSARTAMRDLLDGTAAKAF